MGTHSLIKIIAMQSRGGKQLRVVYVILYTQFDGDTGGVGKQLATFLNSIKLTNGLPLDPIDKDGKRLVNGAGELAAIVVRMFKESSPSGNVYLIPIGPDWEDEREGFTYEVVVEEKNITVSVSNSSEEMLSQATVPQFVAFCE